MESESDSASSLEVERESACGEVQNGEGEEGSEEVVEEEDGDANLQGEGASGDQAREEEEEEEEEAVHHDEDEGDVGLGDLQGDVRDCAGVEQGGVVEVDRLSEGVHVVSVVVGVGEFPEVHQPKGA